MLSQLGRGSELGTGDIGAFAQPNRPIVGEIPAAGTMAAIDNGGGVVGVAPGARLYAVKVLDRRGSGSLSDVIAGIDWVTARADVIDVANMSFGCECSSSAMDTAIANSVTAGITYSVSAGNSNKDTATFSPANHPDVITVSALADSDGAPGGTGGATCNGDTDDTLADFSNWGPDIEITAPGDCILSTYKDGGCAIISGTSMSAPHVGGAAALLAASGMTSPADIRDTLIATGNFNWVDDSGDGIQEQLMDVSDTTIYAPATVPGSSATGCSTDADCDDGDACNGAETCVSGSCQAGTAVDCDDADACTTDSCDTSTGCVNTEPACQDGDGCCPAGCDSQTTMIAAAVAPRETPARIMRTVARTSARGNPARRRASKRWCLSDR